MCLAASWEYVRVVYFAMFECSFSHVSVISVYLFLFPWHRETMNRISMWLDTQVSLASIATELNPVINRPLTKQWLDDKCKLDGSTGEMMYLNTRAGDDSRTQDCV